MPRILIAAIVTLAAAPVVADGIGTFTGRSNHITTGGVVVEQTSQGGVIRLGEDFSLDGAPDPVVGLGHADSYDPNTTAGPLRSLTGAQTYQVPAGIDVSDYSVAYIWCEEFSVPLGSAPLN